MVTETKYIKALRIVETYHEQIGLTDLHLRRSIYDLKPGDSIKCQKIKRENMADSMTVGKAYVITSRAENIFWISNDRNKIKPYEMNIEYWAISD
jgi:hypothetical protein